jgi:hypothetical protein
MSRSSWLGPHPLQLIEIPAASALNQIILLFGASYILFDGGAAVRLDVLKRVWITVVVLATAGVLITAAITGLAPCSALLRYSRCCWARRRPLPIRRPWYRSSVRSGFRSGSRKP